LSNRFPKAALLAAFLGLLAAASAAALDFGLVISQNLKASSETSGLNDLSYTPVAAPWIGCPLGNSFNLYVSGRVGFEYAGVSDGAFLWREPLPLPEFDRTELMWLVSPALSFTVGRQHFEDPSALAASGLYDGLSAAFSAGGGGGGGAFPRGAVLPAPPTKLTGAACKKQPTRR
jgi:hypothetical protein